MSDLSDLLKGATPPFQLSSPFLTGLPASPGIHSATKNTLSLQATPPLSLDLGRVFLDITTEERAPSILTRPPPAREPSVDWGDVLTWIGEAGALGAGLGLVLLTDERPFHAIGGGLIMAAGEGILLELIDRLIRNDHSTRWLRLGISLAAGLLFGLGMAFMPTLDRSGIAGPATNPEDRNPIMDFGP